MAAAPPSSAFFTADASSLLAHASQKTTSKESDSDSESDDYEDEEDEKQTPVSKVDEKSVSTKSHKHSSSSCAEDTVFHTTPIPAHHEMVDYYTQRHPVSTADVKPWQPLFDDGKPFTVLPPPGDVDYTCRVRSRQLTFSVTATPESGNISITGKGAFMCTKTEKELRPILFACQNKECIHSIVPLRITALGHKSANVPLQDIGFALTANRFDLPTRKAPVMHIRDDWLPDRVFGSTTHYGKRETTHGEFKSPYVFGWNTTSTQKVRLYTANWDVVHPDRMDLLTVMCMEDGLLANIHKEDKTGWYLSQPDATTCVAPDWMSFLMMKHIQLDKTGTTSQKRQLWTVKNPKTKQDCFRFQPAVFEKVQARIRSDFDRVRHVMDLSDGLTGVFTPSDVKSWNAALHHKTEKGGEEELVRLSVDIRLDYLVIGGMKSRVLPSPSPLPLPKKSKRQSNSRRPATGK